MNAESLATTRRLAAIVESSDDAIISKDLSGMIQSWNPGAERIFGYKAAEVIGKSIRLIIPDDRQNEEEDVLAKVRRGERRARSSRSAVSSGIAVLSARRVSAVSQISRGSM